VHHQVRARELNVGARLEVRSGDGDVDWQGLFDEVDKSIREEIKKKKTAGAEGDAVDFDFD